MVGGAAGGFVARAFESMLKECANKKYSALQSAIQTYLGAHFWKLFFTFSKCLTYHSIFEYFVFSFLSWEVVSFAASFSRQWYCEICVTCDCIWAFHIKYEYFQSME